MTADSGLWLRIGADAPQVPGFLGLDVDPSTEARLPAFDELPFPDRAADAVVCGPSAAGSTDAALIRLLLECRRVLRPQGVLRICVPRPGSGTPPDAGPAGSAGGPGITESAVPRLAALVGLEPTDRAPVAAHCRIALPPLPAADRHLPAFEFTKRDRRLVGDPLVSILIPAYSPRFFGACLDSALAQTYANIEVVVHDDSEASGIEAIVRARGGGRPIRYERNPVRLGVRANYRKCFASARGEFVKFLCDDDMLAPTCVARLLDAFRQASDVTLATSHRQLIDAEGRHHPDHPATTPIVERDSLIAGYSLVNAMLGNGLNVIGEPSTTLFRRADLLDLAPEYFRFDGVEGHGVIDMVMWSTLLLRGDAVYLRDSLSYFRIHPGQRQQDPAKQQRNMDSMRSLWSAWQALGLHEKLARGQLLANPYPPPADERRVPSATSLPMPPFVSQAWTFTLKPRAGAG